MPDNLTLPEPERRPVLWVLTSHWLSMTGVALVTLAGISWLLVLPQSLSGNAPNPYIGMLIFLAIPAVFFAGLILIPIGIALGRHRIASGFQGATDRRRRWLQVGAFFAAMTLVNVVIASQLTYRAVEHMDSNQFCGQTCHTVMQPEYTAYQQSPHSRVDCVECHIGSGASWFVRSKISGTRQVWAVLTHSYPTPIPSPVENLREVEIFIVAPTNPQPAPG